MAAVHYSGNISNLCVESGIETETKGINYKMESYYFKALVSLICKELNKAFH